MKRSEIKVSGEDSKELTDLICVVKGVADILPDLISLSAVEKKGSLGIWWITDGGEEKLIGNTISSFKRFVATTIGTGSNSDYKPPNECIRLFIAGDRSQVGKSTVCLGLLATFLEIGYAGSELAYIKPATQCEAPQLVGKFCEENGISSCSIGPVVFYSGFTREFLDKNTATSDELLNEIAQVCTRYAENKKILLIDGVGYPAVGSICNLSNAQVAQVAQAPVVLVGKKGVGDAVDSFNLNATFFESFQVRVLGGIFNRISTDGYYNIENCRTYVTKYFQQQKPHQLPYGFIAEIEQKYETAEFITCLSKQFERQVDVKRLIRDARMTMANKIDRTMQQRPEPSSNIVLPSRKTRQQIQAEARALGHIGG